MTPRIEVWTPNPPGRHCQHENCITVLNRFHPGSLCYVHEGASDATWKRRTPAYPDVPGTDGWDLLGLMVQRHGVAA